jgi:hypothetical protein
MSQGMTTRSYGVKEQTLAMDSLDVAAEQIRLVGFAVVAGGLTDGERDQIAERFDRLHDRYVDMYGGLDSLLPIDEHNTIRAPLGFDDAFIALAQNKNILSVVEKLLGNYFILNQQNCIINPCFKEENSNQSHVKPRYNQAFYHRDLPYQHFVCSRPIAINALYCVDPFTVENGATKVIPGTHKQEAFPADETVRALERVVEAPAGSFLVLDCMVFHSGGDNRTSRNRRAVNHVYTLPFIKQQICLKSVFAEREDLDPFLRRLFDMDDQPAAGPADYHTRRRAKLKDPG